MTSICPPQGPSLTEIESTVEGAARALAGTPQEALAGVGLLAAHLTAVDQSLYQVAVERLPASADDVARGRAICHTLMERLRVLERRLAGDLQLAEAPVEQIAVRAQSECAAYRDVERRLCAGLVQVLSADELDRMLRRYHEAMSQAPSRPHPHTLGHRGRPWSWALRIERLVDRVRDTLDARPAPVDVPRRPVRPPGRWATYLLGGAADPPREQPAVPSRPGDGTP